MRLRLRIWMIVRMRVISYDVGDDDPFKKGPARYTRREEEM